MCNHKSCLQSFNSCIYMRVKNQDDPSVNFSYTAQQKILELDQLPVFGAISRELELSQAWALYQKITYYNNFHFNSFLKSLKKHNFGSHQPCTRQTKYILKKGENLPHQPFVLKEKYHNPQYMNYSNEPKLALKSTYESEEAS